ncbi:hypothetical protein CEXT_173011 [Caerostris extrusa]|uniref:Uncharacterized protein n=1 Tax=Caerostris extrusa TaxID=172846 RepID=A0AAV4P8U2_CAEEX|nr:hypothetical protein CEXT_173011 [Caerostris extrusa]
MPHRPQFRQIKTTIFLATTICHNRFSLYQWQRKEEKIKRNSLDKSCQSRPDAKPRGSQRLIDWGEPPNDLRVPSHVTRTGALKQDLQEAGNGKPSRKTFVATREDLAVFVLRMLWFLTH